MSNISLLLLLSKQLFFKYFKHYPREMSKRRRIELLFSTNTRNNIIIAIIECKKRQ